MSTTINGLICSYYLFRQGTWRSGETPSAPLLNTALVVPGRYLTADDDTHAITAGDYDCVYGLAGNDTLDGAEDRDTLDGGAGNDTLRGADGGDWLYGGVGSDELNGGNGDDWLEDDYDDASNDVLRGGPGNDHMAGGAGNDQMHGNAGNDQMHGNAGNDEIHGQIGNDEMHGNAGNDEMNGGLGNDTLRGGDGSDSLYGSHGADTLQGDRGNDTLFGGQGNDRLSGGRGNDTLHGDWGDDTLQGGGGHDEFVFHFDTRSVFESFGSDTISDYTLSASKAESEKIHLCIEGTSTRPTHSGVDSDTDHVITVTLDGATVGTITLAGITTESDDFEHLNVTVGCPS